MWSKFYKGGTNHGHECFLRGDTILGLIIFQHRVLKLATLKGKVRAGGTTKTSQPEKHET